MANIPKLNYSFTDNQTTILAEHLNAFVNRINLLIDAVGEQPTPIQTVATPTISISGTTATISCSTSGATIYYTLNGNTPTTSSTQYSSPITLSGACTIKAIAVKSGMNNSSVASESYTPAVNRVYLNIHDWVDDAYVGATKNVTSKVPAKGMAVMTIYPMSVPSGITSIKVTRPILESEETSMILGFFNGQQGSSSLVSSVEYPKTASEKGTYETITVNIPSETYDRLRMPFWKDKKAEFECYYETTEAVEPQTPVSVAPAITIDGTSLTIAAQAGATIYYTLDGTAPTTASNVYSSAVTLTGNCTIKAIAVESGKSASCASSRNYTA